VIVKAFALVLTLTTAATAGDLLSAVERNQTAAADVQGTPADQLVEVLAKLELGPSDTLIDFGCGDARALVAAVKTYGCKGVGIEIDPEQYRKAKLAIEAAGVADRVEIILGDATTTYVEGNVGFAYLWPDTLEALAPKLTKLDRFASYQHAVPGLAMSRSGDTWFWKSEKPQPVEQVEYTTERVVTGYRQVKHCNGRQCWYTNEPIYETRRVPVKKQEPAKPKPKPVARATQPVAYWGGRAYTGRVCNSRNCTMCNSIASQLFGTR